MAQYANCGENEQEIQASDAVATSFKGECSEGDARLNRGAEDSDGNDDDDSGAASLKSNLSLGFLAIAAAVFSLF